MPGVALLHDCRHIVFVEHLRGFFWDDAAVEDDARGVFAAEFPGHFRRNFAFAAQVHDADVVLHFFEGQGHFPDGRA